jgi:signal transduction histidine kinase
VLGLLRTNEDETPSSPAPGLSGVAALVETMGSAGLRTTWRTAGEPARLAELADLAAYRVVQESLTNALKHGDGTADLVIEHRADEVVVEVTNPLPADAPGSATGGHGLVGMRERVTSLGGTFAAGPDGRSFRVRVEIPRGAVA